MNQKPQPASTAAATVPCSVAPRSIALTPAHNEAAGIAAALESVERQPGVDLVVVVSDNWTDDTRWPGRRLREPIDSSEQIHNLESE